jgi:predicted outer membrane repeat protein
VITGNRALGIGNGLGGGVMSEGSGTLRRTTVSGNFARNEGGGLLSTGNLTLVRCQVDGNTTLNNGGGGLSHSGGSLTLTNSSLMDNRAGSDGGGLRLGGTTTASTITGCTFAGNTAEAGGGGLFFENCQPVTLTHCTVSGNRARDDGGGIQWQNSAYLLSVRNSTIAFNHAGTDGSGAGGGVSNNATAGVVLESVIVGPNTAAFNVDLITQGGGNFQVTYSLIASNILISPSTNILGQDPRLAPLARNGGPTWTHALKKGSPAINKGQNFSGAPFDQRGQPFARRVSGGVDMGAFERQ